MKKLCALLFMSLLLLSACGKGEAPGVGGSTRRKAVTSEELQFLPPQEGMAVATIETDRGVIKAVLYEQYAPLAVENFCGLAGKGYYNDTSFHRVVNGFIIQGGDKSGTGQGGESIWGQPFLNEYSDKLHHYTGALCMASTGGGNLSQFYIMATPQDNITDEAVELMRQAGLREEVIETYRQAGGAPYLDNSDTVFGQVYAGMDIVDEIARAGTDEDGVPGNPMEVQKITITAYTEGVSPSAPASRSIPVPENQSLPQRVPASSDGLSVRNFYENDVVLHWNHAKAAYEWARPRSEGDLFSYIFSGAWRPCGGTEEPQSHAMQQRNL